VPEPASIALLGLGLSPGCCAGVGVPRKRIDPTEAGARQRSAALCLLCARRAHVLEVEVLCTPGKRKCRPSGKGVARRGVLPRCGGAPGHLCRRQPRPAAHVGSLISVAVGPGRGSRVLSGEAMRVSEPSPGPTGWPRRELPHRRQSAGRSPAVSQRIDESPARCPPGGIDARGHGCSDGQDQRTDRQLPCDHRSRRSRRHYGRGGRHRNADRRRACAENEPHDESIVPPGESEQESFPTKSIITSRAASPLPSMVPREFPG